MEPITNVAILEEIFEHDEQIGSFQDYQERIRQLHHRYLESQLCRKMQKQHIDMKEILRFAEDAEFLATQYTNPLVVERHEGLPVEDVPSRKIVQDALAVAGTIFEFLGDTVSSLEEKMPLPEELEELGKSALLYLKSALCYGLGIYEPRTRVILHRLLTKPKLAMPQAALSHNNAKQWEEYLLLALLGHDLRPILRAIPLVRSQAETIRQELRQSLASEDTFSEARRWLPRNRAVLQTSLAIIEACTIYAEAFLQGEERTFEQAQIRLDTAISVVRKVGDYQFEWIIRTFRKVITGMWTDSPWVRLGTLIPRRAYLRKLVEDGIMTLWSSQIAALEMKSKMGPLPGGYLHPQSKRVVIHMPTSAGKTLLAQLAIAHQLFSSHGKKCVYVGPSRALCDQVASDLTKRLSLFNVRVTSVVSDYDLIDNRYESLLFGEAAVIVVTQEKLSHLFRQRSTFISNVALFIFDELHNIGKPDRGWIYEELISLLLLHPETHDAKMLFLSAVMPNHLTVQEWVDPDQSCETVSQDWQPTRTLKGVVQFLFERPTKGSSQIVLQGDLHYVRHKEDLQSPLRVSNFIQSMQVRDTSEPAWWKRDARLSDNEVHHAAAAATSLVKLGPVLIYCPERADTLKCASLLAQRHDYVLPPLNEENAFRYAEIKEFIKKRLLQGHPLVDMLDRQVAFHHGKLPRDVRNEIEFAFQKGWIHILVATTTLVEGVNFPIKTLLLMDYCQRYWNNQQRVWEKNTLCQKAISKILRGVPEGPYMRQKVKSSSFNRLQAILFSVLTRDLMTILDSNLNHQN